MQCNSTNTLVFDSSPSKWQINPELIDYFSKEVPSQNTPPDNHHVSERSFRGLKRYARQHCFTRTINNSESVKRQWLIYFFSAGTIYCYFCKLFCSIPVATDKDIPFVKGFEYWRHADRRIQGHETSNNHNQNICNLIDHQQRFHIY